MLSEISQTEKGKCNTISLLYRISRYNISILSISIKIYISYLYMHILCIYIHKSKRIVFGREKESGENRG